LGSKIAGDVPTRDKERANPAVADDFYRRCGNWLEHTWDTKKFQILFEEHVTYGFRRNLLGFKWPALGINAAIVVFCLGVTRPLEPMPGAGAFCSARKRSRPAPPVKAARKPAKK
jgi:hypothetical protein